MTKHNARKLYVPVKYKFTIAIFLTILWGVFSVIISFSWLRDLAYDFNWFISIAVISGIAYIPGCINAFLVCSLLLDKYVSFKYIDPTDSITLLIAAYNEENGIYETLSYIATQDYSGSIRTIVINNNSSDQTVAEVLRAKEELGLNVQCIDEPNPGKFNALNTGLTYVSTPYTITLDADTVLHSLAIKNLVSRLNSAPDNTAAVAGSVLVRNSRDNLLARLQEWDYFLSIASIKRMQGLFQGTLVAQGAFSIYKTSVLKDLGGWSDAIGEDIVLTWHMLSQNYRVFYEPTAIAFTDVPIKLNHFIKQRSRWARGMIEALREIKPWHQPSTYAKFSTGIDLIIPFMDFSFTFFWIPGLIAALFFQKYYIVGPMTLLVLPLNFISFYILFHYQKYKIFNPLNLRIRKNKRGFILFLLTYQLLMSPISLFGYIQELFNMKRVWK